MIAGAGAAAGLGAGTWALVQMRADDGVVESVQWNRYEIIDDSHVRLFYGAYRSPSCWEPSTAVANDGDDTLVVELQFRRTHEMCTLEDGIDPQIEVDLGASINGRTLRNPDN